jgi:quercetin dioxygenase-like cupin family protein
MDRPSRVIKSRGFRWEGVEPARYRQQGRFRGIVRQVLLGDGAGEGALNFITRYFEIEPGGYSSLERHQHPHSVVVVRGRGRVILDDEIRDLEPFDCVYVAPGSLHQLLATGPEPLGFLCIVDRERDEGQPATEEDLAAFRANPAIAELLRTQQ